MHTCMGGTFEHAPVVRTAAEERAPVAPRLAKVSAASFLVRGRNRVRFGFVLGQRTGSGSGPGSGPGSGFGFGFGFGFGLDVRRVVPLVVGVALDVEEVHLVRVG